MGSVQYQKSARRFYIQVYWMGKRYKIWRHPITSEPFFDRRSAENQLGRIRTEIANKEFHPRYWMPESPMLFRVYASEWLANKKVSPKTCQGYKTDIEKYIIPYFQEQDIRHIRAKHLRLFKEHLEKTLSIKSVYNKMSTLRTLFRDAFRDEDIRRVPPFPVLSPGQITRPESLTFEEQEMQLRAIPERDRAIFAFGMEYGLRVGEVRAIQKDCIRNGRVYIERAFSDNILKSTKTGLVRYYDLTEYAQDILDSLERHLGPFVFVREDGKPYTNKNLNKIWHDAEQKTGIKIKLQNAMRHSLGCQLVDMGHDIYHVADQLGHTDVRTTRRYAVRSRKILTKALEDRRTKIIPMKKDLTTK